MRIGSAGNNLDAATAKGFRQCPCIRLDLGGVGSELRRQGLAKTDGLRRDHLGMKASLYAGENGGLKLGTPVSLMGKNDSAARSAQGFGRRAGYDIGMGQRRRMRPAYDHVSEFSVYVARASRGTGVGRGLLQHLIVTAREIGYHKMVLAAFEWNTAGIALYDRMGFRRVGIYREQGLLDGRWVDTVIMEKLL